MAHLFASPSKKREQLEGVWMVFFGKGVYMVA